jgi:hypothetical protein
MNADQSSPEIRSGDGMEKTDGGIPCTEKMPLHNLDSNDVDPIEVSFTPISPIQNRSMDFLRGCVDTGAPKTVCGKRAAQALCDKLGIRFDLLPSFNRFKLFSVVWPSMGRIHIHLQTTAGNKSLKAEIVDTYIPLLLGLDFMDGMRANANTLTNRLERCEGWSLPLNRFGGHI